MPRSQSLKEPVQHIKDLIAKRGVSGRYGTSLYGANILWVPQEYAHSDTYDDAMDFLRENFRKDPEEYGRLCYHLTHNTSGDLYYQLHDFYSLCGVMLYIRREDPNNELGVTFVFPRLDAKEFEEDIEILSHIAMELAKMARKETGQVRLFANEAFLRWENMEEDNLLYTEYESN